MICQRTLQLISENAEIAVLGTCVLHSFFLRGYDSVPTAEGESERSIGLANHCTESRQTSRLKEMHPLNSSGKMHLTVSLISVISGSYDGKYEVWCRVSLRSRSMFQTAYCFQYRGDVGDRYLKNAVICLLISFFSFPFPFVPLQRRGCLVVPWFL
jgi:hypothetical protein